MFGQRPGVHAEIWVVNDIINHMRANGIVVNSLQDLVSNGVKVIVKGANHGHMMPCPHCYNILKKLNIVIDN
ncbi:MAG: hypothetical protein IPM42_08810 [Saprospiraceae bacterium]|nr:hypothetical protein [Saprospiraceae bacterium]